MTDISFGRLVDLPLRDAWRHEAHQFTPWLAQNIDQLSAAIGIPLELTGTEVAVETFSADILARNPMDDSVVLIENQLETTDHTHLGQIMTYLAGLEAQTVIWIAPAFREPHLSAIRWLNQHTADGFSFFAVKARVVRIGDSPFAPIFEVVEKPNDWERAVTAKAKASNPDIDASNTRRMAFWQGYLDRVPTSADWGLRALRLPSAWVPIHGLGEEANLSLWIGKDECGVFLRGGRGSDGRSLIKKLEPFADDLAARLGATFGGSNGQMLWKRAAWNYHDPAQWADAIDWMEQTRVSYEQAIADIALKVDQ
ncbi:hypothetical protein KBW81_12820 [Loktanella salsilacus]|uniref:hypothetical protein n=1 Tax=Loktanella salsilacus TaxID=195913 RepID=UPI0020B77078|nr:hypothetical protein [Loktanella salsilacus]UTH47589.1 hypothetical protein KBW81_12820 [Loktanella salsilacus]